VETSDSISKFLKPREARRFGLQITSVLQKLEPTESVIFAARADVYAVQPNFSGIAALTAHRLIVSLVGGGHAMWGSYAYRDIPYVRIMRDVATIGPDDLVVSIGKTACDRLKVLVCDAGGTVIKL